MAYVDENLNDPSLYFTAYIYSGSGSDRSFSDIGFQPDLIWIKQRNGTGNHRLIDSVRGNTKLLYSTGTNSEDNDTSGVVSSFDSNGYSTTNEDSTVQNTSGETYVNWLWKAGGSASSNSDGDITSSVSANTTAGFSIATYTGNNSNAQTIGHGLGVAPKVYIIKRRDSSSAWGMYHGSLGTNKYLQVESTNAVATDTGIWNNTAPTSTVLSLGNAGYFNNASSGTYVCYAFSEVKGYSSIGTYIGNGSADGTFVYTGFKPAWVMLKQSSEARNWLILDNKRDTYNPYSQDLLANATDAEQTNVRFDSLSNGFKFRLGSSASNKSGETYIYMAFAEAPFVNSKGVPCNAR